VFDLSGKTALVTGASGGIGGAIARAIHAQGAAVALSGTRQSALDAPVTRAVLPLRSNTGGSLA
jgi:3-oxoacyl-[acyl-carrier protein] reductase